jgi:hypothetical protein
VVLSLKKLVSLDGQKAVLYRSRMNPSLGRNFEAMDPLEWLARMADQIPDTGKHRTHFYGFYASRVRASRRETEASDATANHQAAPCAEISDEILTKRLLTAVGLSPPEDEKPAPIRELVRAAIVRHAVSRS